MARLGPVLVVAAAACAAPTTLPADAVLGAAPVAPAAERGGLSPTSFDAAAREAIERASLEPSDARAAARAARSLFEAADLRVQLATARRVRTLERPGLADVLNADDAVRTEVAAEVLSLVVEGRALAERALELDPELDDAHLWRATLLSLECYARGPGNSLASGLGPRMIAAVDDCVGRVPAGFDDAAGARLLGRVRSRAPWPYRDLARARAALETAARDAPIALNLLFLGDAFALSGDVEGAREAWERALSTAGSDPQRALAPVHRELARARLDALGSP